MLNDDVNIAGAQDQSNGHLFYEGAGLFIATNKLFFE